MISEETARRIATALERLAFAQEQANEIASIDSLTRTKAFNPAYFKPMCLRCYPTCFKELGHLKEGETT